MDSSPRAMDGAVTKGFILRYFWTPVDANGRKPAELESRGSEACSGSSPPPPLASQDAFPTLHGIVEPSLPTWPERPIGPL